MDVSFNLNFTYLVCVVREKKRYVVQVVVEEGTVQRAVAVQILRVDVGPEPQENPRHFGELALVGDDFVEGGPALLADGINIDVGILRLSEKV